VIDYPAANVHFRVGSLCYTLPMTVRTIPEIDEMTAAQQIELMEALWKA
jgi:hypothetical protein